MAAIIEAIAARLHHPDAAPPPLPDTVKLIAFQ